jgi:tetratricopeptide (TPR) repeat protein
MRYWIGLVMGCAAALWLAASAVHAGPQEDCYNDNAGVDARMQACSELISRNPRDIKALLLRASLYNDKNDFDRAIADYRETFKLEPGNAYARKGLIDVYSSRAIDYEQKGDYDREIADCSEVIKLDPSNEGAYFGRGYAYFKKQDHDRAIADYSEAISLNPKAARELYERPRGFERGHQARSQ